MLVQPVQLNSKNPYVKPKPAKPFPLNRYLEKFVNFAGKGHLPGLQRILEEIGHERMEILVKISFKSVTPLYEAAKGGHLGIIKFLLKFQPIIDSHNGKTRGTPLLAGVSSGNEECIKILLENGANPDLETTSGLTPRKLAIDKGMGDLFI